MIVNLMNNENVKIQGPSYYTDCYKWWDLNLCKTNFESSEYQQMIQSNFSQMPFWNRMACINLQQYVNYDEYYKTLSKNVRRDVSQSQSKHIYEQFDINDYVYDFSEINHSQNKRKGSINKWYLQHPTNFLGCSYDSHEWEDENHYSKWFGVFKYLKHYKQGDKVTNKKLLAYCKLCVDGEMSSISLIWSHSNYLKNGITAHLITNVADSCFSIDKVKCLVYYSMQPWKTRLGFKNNGIELQI
jgi:hypothetical protein